MENLVKASSRLLACAAVVVLAACGGGSDSSTKTVGVEGIRENVQITNLDPSFPWIKPQPDGVNYDEYVDPTENKIKHWNIAAGGLIPVKHSNFQPAIHAMDVIEEKMGMLLFDRNSILNVPDDEIERGIVVSPGTAIGFGGPSANACGHVGEIGGRTNYPYKGWYGEDGAIYGPLQVNIGSDHSEGCTNGANINQIAIHEFMHALGLGQHFSGFGIGPIFDDNAWNALYTILVNELLTGKDELIIEQRF